MKIGGPGGTGGAAPIGAGARRASPAAGFAPAAAARGAAAASASAGVAGLSGLETLLALQDVGGPLERRRRAVARGGRLLDDLDRVRLAILDGEDGVAALTDLRRSAAERRERADEPGLDGLLDQIDLRAAVELAKSEIRARA